MSELKGMEQENASYVFYFTLDKKIGVKACAETIQLVKLIMAMTDIVTPEIFSKIIKIGGDNLVSLLNMTVQENFTKDELIAFMDTEGEA